LEYRTLAQTDLKVSRVCLGTMTFGKQTDGATAARMVEMCLDAGINFLDTANVYSGGASEEILGRMLGGRRQEIVLASKAGSLGGKPPRGPRLRRGQIVAEAEKSLRRLRTGYLDLYYLHQPDYETPMDESLAALEELVHAGKVRHTATSNFASWQVAEALAIAGSRGYRPPAAAQQMYNVLNRRLEPEFVPMAEALKVSILVYNPLAGGLLTGKHRPGEPTAGTRFDGNKEYQRRYWKQTQFDAVEDVRKLSDRCGRSMVDISLSWLLHHTAADCVILGASKLEHLEQNLAACEAGPLPEAVLNGLDDVWRRVGGVAANYNR